MLEITKLLKLVFLNIKATFVGMRVCILNAILVLIGYKDACIMGTF